MTSHAAAGSAAGYLHQMQVALLELWERAPEDPDVSLRIEATDDIELRTNEQPSLLIESKHHLEEATLSDRSVDLWRTI